MLYLEPSSARESASRIVEILTDAPLRTSLVERGRKQAGQLSWSNHVRKVLVGHDERSTRLQQSSPFAGEQFITRPERCALIQQFWRETDV